MVNLVAPEFGSAYRLNMYFKPMKALIVDDVAEARQTLTRDIRDYCKDVELLGEADGVVSGAKMIRELKPELVFLDVEMRDGNGFDLLDIVNDAQCKVIFITGSDAYALKAFRYAALDYLLKPVDPEDLQKAVEKARKSVAEPEALKLLKEQMQSPKKAPERLALHTQDKVFIVAITEIIRCESDGNYTKFYINGNKPLLVTRTLKEFDDLLSPYDFIRVHQSHLIHLKYLKEFNKRDGGYLVMHDGASVPVSTRKRAEVLERLEG